MAYFSNTSKAKPLPGASIKGAGVLAPGVYVGTFQTKMVGSTKHIEFISLPAGIHSLAGETEASLAAINVPYDGEYSVRVALSPGCMIVRGDGGRLYAADSYTRAPLTEQYTNVHDMLIEAASKKLSFSSPVIVEIKGKNNDVLFTRNVSN
jgi:hypothetical protein